MSRTTEFMDNFDRTFDDFEKEGLSLDDFLLKTKFNFNSGKLNFSSKSKFALAGAKSRLAHEYTLKHKCPKMTAEFKHTASGTTSLEAEGSLFRQNDLEVTGLAKTELDQGADRRNLSTKVQLRVHHRNNALVSAGVENWNTLNGAPHLYSAYGSYGHVADGTRLTFNGYLSYNALLSFAPLARFFVKATRGDLTGLVVANVNRRQVEAEDKSKKVENDVDLQLRFLNTVDSKTRVGGTLSYDVGSKVTNAVFVASHALDRVRLNARVSTDRSFTAGITSTFDDVTLNFAANSTLGSATEKVGETETQRYWVDYRFGLSAEFNRL